MKSSKHLVWLALMTSFALVLSIVESWIPLPIAIPGIKLGLANIIILIIIQFFGVRDALLVVLVRCILSSIFGGGLIIFLFSLAGGFLSTIVMALMMKKCSRLFSIYGVSIAGAVVHNIGQLAMASILMEELAVMSYLPILLVSGLIMGGVVGMSAQYLSTALIKNRIFEINKTLT